MKLVNIYGTNRVIKEIDLGFIKIPMGVQDYPSDGIIYVHSSSYIEGLISRGAKLQAQKGFDKNHVALAINREVFEWMEKQLRAQK